MQKVLLTIIRRHFPPVLKTNPGRSEISLSADIDQSFQLSGGYVGGRNSLLGLFSTKFGKVSCPIVAGFFVCLFHIGIVERDVITGV